MVTRAGMNILIVEDCSELAKLWQRALERVGAVVARSQSVTEAIFRSNRSVLM